MPAPSGFGVTDVRRAHDALARSLRVTATDDGVEALRRGRRAQQPHS